MQAGILNTNLFTNAISKISLATRSQDWRLSFLPFVMGGVYLWLWWFQIDFSASSVLMVFLSLITTIGFASLGYFINEFFDKESDAKAGKINKLAYISGFSQFSIFIIAVSLTLLPWIWLPTNILSLSLIALQISLFLVYSLPFPRLKETLYISLIIDASYAYIVPLILSFYTFSLYAQKPGFPFWFFLFIVAVFFIGIRNIIVHQVNDIAKDKRIGLQTLPTVLGVAKTNRLVFLIVSYEIFFLTLWAVALFFHSQLIMFWIFPYTFIAFITIKVVTARNYKISSDILLINRAYQYLFPLFAICILITLNPVWVIILFMHVVTLIPRYFFVKAREFVKTTYYRLISFVTVKVRNFISRSINLPIYWLFRLFGVDLMKEGKSAFEYIKCKLLKN